MPSLCGIEAIADHLGKTTKTALKLIRENNLPAVKVRGEWLSDTELISRWRRVLVEEATLVRRGEA